MTQKIDINDSEVIIKRYSVRRTGRKGRSLETTIPREVFEREARKQNMNPREALKKLDAVWRFNSFKGLHLSFEPKEDRK